MNKTILIVGVCLLVIAVHILRIILTDEQPNDEFIAMKATPPRTIGNPKSNGYFFLLGFASSPTVDPVQTGYEMWLEVESDRGHRFFDYDKESRLQLQVEAEADEVQQAWADPNPLAQFQELEETLKSSLSQYGILMSRYRRWLTMPFEDWGNGHPGSPRFADLFAIHRLYVADGFAQDIQTGIDRLEKDLNAWRVVLAQAKTLPTKIMAASVVDDDAVLLSGLLSRPDLDIAQLPRLAELARPLDPWERSLRWPIQNEFILGVSRYESHVASQAPTSQKESENNKKWVAAIAGLNVDVFKKIEFSPPSGLLARAAHKKQKALNIYAKYFQAINQVYYAQNSALPKFQDFATTAPSSFMDYLNPFDDAIPAGTNLSLEPFTARILETEARLRLASLQAMLRRPTRPKNISALIVEAGSVSYDPFTGFPMLLSQSSGRLYSVGRDGRDDGGDPKLDISVQTLLLEEETSSTSQAKADAKTSKAASKK
ncbi:MAG: hypothetical protein HY581_01400 [Nitrospirae bacterium]|nr:hypothetical protein [Nitrospirota bacterium]